MRQVYFLNIRTGELRRAGGMYVDTYASNRPDLAIEEVINVGYDFLAMNETHILFVKVVSD